MGAESHGAGSLWAPLDRMGGEGLSEGVTFELTPAYHYVTVSWSERTFHRIANAKGLRGTEQ